MNTHTSTDALVTIDTELFARVLQTGYLERLAQSRLIRFGIGSQAHSVEDSVRAGVGQIVLIDNGRVERCNIATQGYYAHDIGQPKVDALAKRLRAINPMAAVQTVFSSIHDLTDADFKRIINDPFEDLVTAIKVPAPVQTLLIGATDDFYCQCRVNALALNFGLPSICCQHYQDGLASEITFTHPQTVRACHRCILSSRYYAFLENSYQNFVGSTGSPISSAAMLNALTVALTLAIFHHGTKHPRWGNLLARIGDRNLVQVRNHPDADDLLGFKNFSQAFAGANSGQIFFGETIWRKQQPEHPDTGYSRPCPDCGGTGDLAKCLGTFADTRIINH